MPFASCCQRTPVSPILSSRSHAIRHTIHFQIIGMGSPISETVGDGKINGADWNSNSESFLLLAILAFRMLHHDCSTTSVVIPIAYHYLTGLTVFLQVFVLFYFVSLILFHTFYFLLQSNYV